MAAFNPEDWPVAATNSDVIGFDDFTPGPLEPQVVALFTTTSNKPVMLGAWGVPSDYAGMRGFGWNQDTDAMTLSDSASGDAYDLRLQSLAANPYVVGAMVFQYNDQPLAGNGTGSSTNLVNGENRAFGMVDVTDTPKYDLVNKVRTANLTALQSIGLLPPSLTIARQSDNSIVISWPVSVTGFTLKNAASLLSTNWVATPNVQSNQVIVSPSKRREFYRLEKQ